MLEVCIWLFDQTLSKRLNEPAAALFTFWMKNIAIIEDSLQIFDYWLQKQPKSDCVQDRLVMTNSFYYCSVANTAYVKERFEKKLRKR